MLSSKTSSNIINASDQQQIKTCLQEIQQEVEASYNRLSDSIEQIFAPSNFSCFPKFTMPSCDNSLTQSIFSITSNSNNLKNQLIQEIKPLLSTIISKEVKMKEQSLNEKYLQQTKEFQQKFNNLLEEKKRVQEEIINIKQQEIQQIQVSSKQELIKNQSPVIYNLKPFKFELMQTSTIKQQESCYAIAINKNSQIVVAAYQKQIKVFENKQGKLNQLQVLSEHSGTLYTLNFMKKSNHFLSGGTDSIIIIWQMNQNNQWIFQQKLCEHKGTINCILLNDNEDLIISGSADKCIKFWSKQNLWLCQQTITDHTGYVYSLSLNEQQDKLISCGSDSYILVIEQSQQKDKMWSVIQKIKVDQYGYRLCFITDRQFTFQPYCKEQMHIYDMNIEKQFVKTKEIIVKFGSSCDYLFPQQYIKSKCLLVNKNSQNINLIRKNKQEDFILEQNIQFVSGATYGQLSDDGEYLIIWDCQTREIQVRKFMDL